MSRLVWQEKIFDVPTERLGGNSGEKILFSNPVNPVDPVKRKV